MFQQGTIRPTVLIVPAPVRPTFHLAVFKHAGHRHSLAHGPFGDRFSKTLVLKQIVYRKNNNFVFKLKQLVNCK